MNETIQVGVLVFEGVEELDFVGPWEVFGLALRDAPERCVHLLAQSTAPVRCAKGLLVTPDHALEEAPALDVLVVPGGRGVRRELHNQALLDWIAAQAERVSWMTSVCTGAGLLVQSGVARNRRVTTHHAWVDELRALAPCEVVEDVRYVRDGQLLTAAGIAAGIDMSLHLVELLWGEARMRETRRHMQLD